MAHGTEQWFVFQNNERLGPLTFGELTQKISQRQIQPESFAYTDGYTDWIPISQIPQLMEQTQKNLTHSKVTATAVTTTAAPVSKEVGWSVHKDGQTLGPFLQQEMTEKIQSGELLPTDYVWTDGWADWMPLNQTQEWQPLLQGMSHASVATHQPEPEPEPQMEEAPSYAAPEPTMETRRYVADDSIDDTRGPESRFSLKRVLVLILIFGGGAAAYLYRDIVLNHPQLQGVIGQVKGLVQKKMTSVKAPDATHAPAPNATSTPPPATAPSSPATTSAPTAPGAVGIPTPAAPMGPSLKSALLAIAEPVGISSQSLYGDAAIVLVKHKPSVPTFLIAHSDSNPYFSLEIIRSAGTITMVGPLAQDGAAQLYLFQQQPDHSVSQVSQKKLTFSNGAYARKHLPLPQRLEQLTKTRMAVDQTYKRVSAQSARPLLWAKNQSTFMSELDQHQMTIQQCLTQLHLPHQCAQLSLLLRDARDLYRYASLAAVKTPVKQITGKVGRSANQIVKSYAQTLKELESFSDAGKAVETVDPGDLTQWLQNAFAPSLTGSSSVPVL